MRITTYTSVCPSPWYIQPLLGNDDPEVPYCVVGLFVLVAAREDLSRDGSGEFHWLTGVADVFEGLQIVGRQVHEELLMRRGGSTHGSSC